MRRRNGARHGRWAYAMLAVTLGVSGCIGSAGSSSNGISAADQESLARRQFPLSSLATATVTINGNALRVWLATASAQRSEGLMFVPDSAIATDQGMLFVFPAEEQLSFWMKNTIIPLDIAFARSDGTIVAIHTMPPLTLDTFPSIEPAMFALEVKSGTWVRLGVKAGDRIVIPDDVFK